MTSICSSYFPLVRDFMSWTTFCSDFHFDPIFPQPLRSPRKRQTTLQSWGEYLRDLREAKPAAQPLHPVTQSAPHKTSFWPGLTACRLLVAPSVTKSACRPDQRTHTWQPVLWVAVAPARASPVWASLRFSQVGKESQEEGLVWILWHVINGDCKQWGLTCSWGRPSHPLKAVHVSPSLWVLVLLGEHVTK